MCIFQNGIREFLFLFFFLSIEEVIEIIFLYTNERINWKLKQKDQK
jgi:hypothetical protein